ncbi:right-handed parallel beta-helix repeat-containing protein [bacterium]|nr:right-handed parallel beta-helix repeat-containing protein [bacterium]
MTEKTIHVRDFGAIPGDGQDDVPGIQAAFDHAASGNATRILFDAGIYELDQPKWNCLTIKVTDGLTLEGAVDEGGEPATRLVRRHDLHVSKRYPPAILYVERCDRFTLRNIAFDNSPRFTSAGTVIEKKGDTITVEILEGLPVIENVQPFCANLWDPETRTLKKVPSVTFGGDVDKHKEMIWKRVPGDDGRRLSLTGDHVASKVEVDDLMSWHFGYNGVQVQISDCRDLRLSNLLTVNTIGFGMQTAHCTNIAADRIVFRPEGNQLAVGSRDAWKMYAGGGEIRIEDTHCEGVRWDAQNVHGSFMWVRSRVDETTFVARKRGGTYFPIEPGSILAFWDGPNPVERTVAASQGKSIQGNAEATLTLTEPLPDFVAEETLVSVYDWDIPSYTLRNCTFRNIAGCASILRNRHALFDRCTYEHIMYPAILVGASVNEGEGTFPQDVTIRDCVFRSSGWSARHDAKGCVGIRNLHGANGLYMGRIVLTGNRFEDSDLGIDIGDAREVVLENNTFKDVTTHWQVDPGSETNLVVR